MEEQVLPRLPRRLHAAAHALIFEWDRPIQPVPGMAGFLEECKKAGLGLYLLSNASVRQPEYWPRVPGSHLFDGGVVSAFCHMAKPSPEIYRYTLEKFHLPSEECLFVDDVGENVTAAAGVGMEGFLFTGDVAALRRKVRSFGIPLSPESEGEALTLKQKGRLGTPFRVTQSVFLPVYFATGPSVNYLRIFSSYSEVSNSNAPSSCKR